MDILLYNSEQNDYIKFPVIPKENMVSSPQEINKLDTIGQGEINLAGLLGNRQLSITSFFPVRSYYFSKDSTYTGMGYIDKIEKWRKERKPLYISVSDINIAMRCNISNLDYGIIDGSGDIAYSLKITEFVRDENYVKKNSSTNTKKITATGSTTPLADASVVNSEAVKKNTHTGAGIGFEISKIISTAKRIKMYREFGKDWIQIKGGFILKKHLK